MNKKEGRREERKREREGGDVKGPKKRRVDTEAELPMALNQLASVPGSLGTFREALGEGGRWRTYRGGSEFHTDTYTQTARTERQGTWEERENMGVPSRVVQQVTPPNPYFR